MTTDIEETDTVVGVACGEVATAVAHHDLQDGIRVLTFVHVGHSKIDRQLFEVFLIAIEERNLGIGPTNE